MSRFTTFGLTILLAFAPAALAVDGIVLINQSTITNGLTGCPTGGHFPIIICQSGSYRLSGNLIMPDVNTTAIQINADNVTFDLNGFSILGPVVCSGLPVTSCSPNGSGIGINSTNSYITISNGTVRGFGTLGIFLVGGVSLTGALAGAGLRIEGVTVSNNAAGGIVSGGEGSIFNLCHAIANGNSGITGHGTLTNSSALFNSIDGITWGGSATGNSSRANGGSGFSGQGVFTANEAADNKSFGISVSQPSVITSNQIFRNGGTISFVSGSVISNNVAQ